MTLHIHRNVTDAGAGTHDQQHRAKFKQGRGGRKGSRLYKAQMPWEELLSARGTGARQSALFIGRIRGRLKPKDLGQLAGGIHHNAVGIVFVVSLNVSRAIPPTLKRSRLSQSN
jgi:hypothetical protein